MKILLVSGDFYPHNTPRAFRTTELVKRFCVLGHNVTLYIPESSDDLSVLLEKYHITIRYYVRKKPLAINGFVGKVMNRLLQQFLDYPEITIFKELQKKLQNESGYDLLLSIAMPHQIHWAIGQLYKRDNIIANKWIADCGDPYMLCGTNQFSHPSYFAKYEKLWCEKCDFISVPTKDAMNGYYPEFRHKVRVIPQGFDFTEVKRKEYKAHSIPTFAFSGNIIPHVRDPRPFLDYLASKNVNFKFVMYTSKPWMLTPYLKSLEGKIEIHPFIPRLELLEILSGMDFLINFENATSVQTPSKLIDYGLTNRPILSIDTRQLDVNKIDEFMSGEYRNRYQFENFEDYNIEKIVDKFLSII